MQMKEIVIVGGGAGGLHLATKLGRRVRRRGLARITLIDRSYSHVWKPLLHEVAAGTLDTGVEQVGFVPQASRSGFRYWPGDMIGLDRAAKRIRLAPLLDRHLHAAHQRLETRPGGQFPLGKNLAEGSHAAFQCSGAGIFKRELNVHISHNNYARCRRIKST